MQFAISGSESSEKGTPTDLIKNGKMAEEAGFDMFTMGDSQSLMREVFTSLTLVAYNTDTIQVGPMVTNPVTRHPVVTTSAACTINDVSNGRAVLGIATGDNAVFTLGKRPARLSRMEEVIELIRTIRTGESAEFEGNEVQLKWLNDDNQPRELPIYWAAEGPKTQRLAGQLADAVVFPGLEPEPVTNHYEQIMRGAEEAGRDPDDVDIWVQARCNVADTRADALDDLKPSLAAVAHHSLLHTMADKAIPEEYVEPLTELVENYTSKEHNEPGENPNAKLVEDLGLTEFLAQRYGVVGTPEDCIEKLEAVEDIGLVDGVFFSTPRNRTREVITYMDEAVFPALRD